MPTYIALLRAVNVGGTGKLPMADLKSLCQDLGFEQVRTYIASGNVVFQSNLPEAEVKSVLNAGLHAYAGKPVGAIIRTAAEIAGVVKRNPFSERPGNRSVALFVDEPLPADALLHATGGKDEVASLGLREIFIFYPTSMADSRLRIPAAKAGTARNMNTVAKLAEMAAAL